MGVAPESRSGCTAIGSPQDPVIYRLYEVLIVYGTSYKALINEKVGQLADVADDSLEMGSCLLSVSEGATRLNSGFRTSVEKKKDETGDRVVITLDGKVRRYESESDDSSCHTPALISGTCRSQSRVLCVLQDYIRWPRHLSHGMACSNDATWTALLLSRPA